MKLWLEGWQWALALSISIIILITIVVIAKEREPVAFVSHGNVSYGISCKTICESHNWKTLGSPRKGIYNNAVCICGNENTGEIWTFIMG